MAEPEERSDPFAWSPEQLIHEFRVLQQSRGTGPGNKWPNLDRLSELLLEHELGGEDLLSFEDLGGSFDSLCNDLEIKKIAHKATLRSVIELLKGLSPAYQDWKDARVEGYTHLVRPVPQETPRPPPLAADDENVESLLEHQIISESRSMPGGVPPKAADKSQSPDPRLASKKRKRVVPINIAGPFDSWVHARSVRARMNTTEEGARNTEKIWQDSTPGAYLGDWKLPWHVLLPTPDLQEPQDAVLEIFDFGWSVAKPIPPGRRLQVNKILRRLLKPKRSNLNLGRRLEARPSIGLGIVDDDEVLPALGESDDDYDSETWEEIEEEERERVHPVPRKDVPLSAEVIDAIIHAAMRDMEAKWAEKKLPRLQKNMHTLWVDASRSGSLVENATRERSIADVLDRRIANIIKTIHSDEWKNEAQVRNQAGILDASVEDRQRALWQAKLFSMPTPPKKPKTTRQPVVHARVRTFRARIADDGDEVLTSDEEDMDEFVVHDEDDMSGVEGDAMDIDSAGDASETEGPSHDDHDDVMDTATPPPTTTQMPRVEDTTIEKPPLEDLEAISAKGTTYWGDVGDVPRLLCTLLAEYSEVQLRQLFGHMDKDDNAIWNMLCVPEMHDTEASRPPPGEVSGVFTRLFDAFLACRAASAQDFFPLSSETRRRLEENRGRIGEFCVQLRILQPYFASRLPVEPSTSAPIQEPTVILLDSDDDDEADVSGESREVFAVEEEDSDDNIQSSPSYRRRRKIHVDKAAQKRRQQDKVRVEAQNRRRELNRSKFISSSTVDGDRSRLIINDAREDNQSPIYINAEIGRRIRDHQIGGVRFMWNELLVPANGRQGCLLAHTMGLGKTMQVITLLVALAEASQSPDENIVSQVPKDLRESKTLILCPSGLVENWLDELSCWTPPDLLGICYPIVADMPREERLEAVEQWSSNGGVLVLGYPMLRKLIASFGDEIKGLLENSPNIVVADEAHALKNPKSKVHEATANFKTRARIAMTGSPLANSVEEYHSMIDWVAPGYLADHREFAAMYANPIKEGFYRDSTAQQRRRALLCLRALKETVAPRIHRATVATLKGVLPQKKEVILYLPLTALQAQVYNRFLGEVDNPMLQNISSTVQLWNLLFNLTLLLAHPKVFKLRLEEMKSSPSTPQANGSSSATLPLPIVSELLAIANRRDIDDLLHSSKVLVLMGILDEARAVGDKVLVFSQSKLVLDYLEDVFQRKKRRFCRLDGDTAVRWRQGMVKTFNTGQDEIYLISTTAGGVGLNIQGANRVVIFDFRWNPIHEQQAIGRAYRIGQTKPVFVYWLITGGTFETVLHDQAVFKTQLASRVVDKKNPHAWANQMRNYTARPKILPPDPSVQQFQGQDVVLDSLLKSDTLRNRICKIVSTDTFEEEEPEDQLSTEELREANSMIHMNELRHHNPRGPAWTFPTERTATDGTFFAPMGVQTTANTASAPPVPSGPVTLPDLRDPPGSSGASGPRLPDPRPPAAPAVVPSNVPSDMPRPSNAFQQPTLPLSTRPVTTQANNIPSSIADPPTRIAVTTPPVTTSFSNAAANELEAVLQKRLTEGMGPSRKPVGTVSAKGQAHKLVSDIMASMQVSGLPATAQLQRIRDFVGNDTGFANAVISGHVSPPTLATMDTPTADRLLQSLHDDAVSDTVSDTPGNTPGSPASSVATTPQMATTGRSKDPDHIKAHLHRSMHREHRPRSGSGTRDMLAIRELLDRRKSRKSAVLAEANSLQWHWPAQSLPVALPGVEQSMFMPQDSTNANAWPPAEETKPQLRDMDARPSQAGDDPSNPCVLD